MLSHRPADGSCGRTFYLPHALPHPRGRLASDHRRAGVKNNLGTNRGRVGGWVRFGGRLSTVILVWLMDLGWLRAHTHAHMPHTTHTFTAHHTHTAHVALPPPCALPAHVDEQAAYWRCAAARWRSWIMDLQVYRIWIGWFLVGRGRTPRYARTRTHTTHAPHTRTRTHTRDASIIGAWRLALVWRCIMT